MAQHPLRLAVIIGSVRPGRFGPTVAHWFADRARKRSDMDVDVIDLAEVRLSPELTGSGAVPDPETAHSLEELSRRLAGADAFVMVTPEYNHSFPAALKTAIDLHDEEWHAKPVGFVSYGGLSGGLRAVEQLRPVLAELHAVTVRDTVSFHGVWGCFDGAGTLTGPEGHEQAAEVLLDRIGWWGRALRDARAVSPYAA